MTKRTYRDTVLRPYTEQPTRGGYTRLHSSTCPLGLLSCCTPPWHYCEWFGAVVHNRDNELVDAVACTCTGNELLAESVDLQEKAQEDSR